MPRYQVKKSDVEIDDLLNQCCEQEDQGGSRFSGMSYEQGMRAAIEWLTNEEWDHPYPAD